MKFKPALERLKKKLFSIDRKRALTSVLLCAISFLLFAAYWNTQIFPSDEAEIFLHGQSIASGLLLYKDVASQHTPIMYYIAAVFSLLGAKTVLAFRLFFYGLFSVIYGAIYYRYSKHLSRKALFIFPIAYIISLYGIQFGAAVLSDQMQAIGMAVLFLEFIIFTKTHELPIKSCIAISFAIFVSFGSAFVSAFAIFVLFIAVLAFDLSAIGEKRPECNKTARLITLKYLRLFGIVLLPIALLVLYFLVSGSIVDMYTWVYKINVSIYPKYIGYSMDVIENIFNGFTRFFGFFDEINWGDVSGTVLLRIILILLTITYLLKFSFGRGALIKLAGAAIFISACATRGLFDYHGTPAVIILALSSALAVGEFLESHPIEKPFSSAVAAVLALIVISPYCQNALPNLFRMDYREDVADFQDSVTSRYLDALTDEGERVGFSTLDCHYLVQSGTIPAMNQGGSVPWFWEMGKAQAMAELTAAPPRVYIYYQDLTIWGYHIDDYAPELVDFIESNYTQLERGTSTIWVLNSYYEEAMAIIDALP